jgi:dihydrofolate reductase
MSNPHVGWNDTHWTYRAVHRRLGVMRRLINSTYITLDGVIQDPQDWPPTGAEDDGRGFTIQNDLLQSCDAQIMGRRTYEGFAPVWSTRAGDPYSDHINAMRKLVFSSRVSDPEWSNTEVVTTDPVAFVRELKAAPGADIVHYGFGHLAHVLMRAGLIDELRLWVHPFFLGRGGLQSVIYSDGGPATFALAETIALASGIVVLTYRTS